VATNRLLKSLLPSSCIWTGIRESEGLSYQNTLITLDELYPSEDEMTGNENKPGSSLAVPEAIRSVLNVPVAIEALGTMIW
jgi:DNA mismatch repair protein MSH6